MKRLPKVKIDILVNDQIPVIDWMNFLAGNRHATPFQSFSFFKLFNSVEQLSADAIAISKDGNIKALAVVTIQKETGLRSYFSRRGIIYGGPLVSEDSPDALDILLKQLSARLRGRVIYTETRNLSDYSCYKHIFINNGLRYIPYLNIILDTANIEIVKHNVSNSRMRQIKAARRDSVTWEEAKSLEEVRVFHRILNRLYKEKIGKPILPIGFFERFFESDLGKFLMVWHDNKIIGGIMCPIMEQSAIYEFYVCGLDREYLRQYPSIMATWAAIEYASVNNISRFDFMGAGSPDKKYSVRDFKSRFGGREVEFGRFIQINNRVLYMVGKIAVGLSSRKKR